MALMLAAIVGQLEMPCSVLEERLVDDVSIYETFQRAINRDLVGGMGTGHVGDLLLGQRAIRL